MAVKISTLGITVTGPLTRKHDAETDTTTLEVSLAQAQEIHTAVGKVLEFFGSLNVEAQDTPPTHSGTVTATADGSGSVTK